MPAWAWPSTSRPNEPLPRIHGSTDRPRLLSMRTPSRNSIRASSNTFTVPTPQALYQEAERLFERTLAEFGDLKSPRRGQPLAETARSALHELRNLSLGRIAPEIDGKDADGVPFKLSDYRGKVVVLTFSGNWCSPCRGMYPEEREFVKRLEGKRFALLSVNTDGDRETLRKSIQDGEITWRCWWDGSPEGPICQNWNVTSFPTIYVLDGNGAIRFKNIHGLSLDEAVKKLLKDLEASPPKP
jgi:thiol-disulfide isomerase/thioredoxin